jgi:serine/threonine protein kinase
MSAADPTAAFFSNLRAARLVAPALLQELWVWSGSGRANVQAVARELTRRGLLTAYQVKEVFHGRGRALTLDRYVLLDLLGEGGMGRVYKAHDTRMGRDLAVKVIRADKLKHPAAAARFEQEIQALSKMSHPNVVTLFDAGRAADTHFYVMELIDGTDLTKMVRDRGPLPVPEACAYIRQAALGLEHARLMGLVHRDVKPSNILVSRDGRAVKLVDLGLARVIENADAAGGEEAGRITQEGFVIGTPDFLAPEQARNPMAVDIRADIYALGGTLFYVLTGRVPFDGANPTEKLIRHCTAPPPPLLPWRPDAPPPVEQIVHWCLAKPADARPQTPKALADALLPFCPPPASGRYPVPGPGSGRVPFPPAGYAPAPAYPSPTAYPYPAPPPAPPAPLPAPPPEPNRSSQIFRLPPQTTEADPIRRRAEPGFPWGTALLGLGVVLVATLLAGGVYLQFFRPAAGPVEGFTNSQGMRMVRVDGGTFRMGSPADEPGRKADEGPAHDVSVRGPLLMSAAEVTHAQFTKVTGASPARAGGLASGAQNLPVESVTWDEATDFCRRLTELEKNQPWARRGWAYRLPTEAEWEYAARAGAAGPFAFGPQVEFGRQAVFRAAKDDPLGVAADPKAPAFAQEAGRAEANRWGLHDLHGNVAEWCSDWYKPGYPGEARADPTGPADGDRRVVRGGSYRTPAAATRSAARDSLRPSDARPDVGFRVVYAPAAK